jgi:hypothetical protein
MSTRLDRKPLSKTGRIRAKLLEDHWQIGDQILIAIAADKTIYTAAEMTAKKVSVSNTGKVTYDRDGIRVPIWLVTFTMV